MKIYAKKGLQKTVFTSMIWKNMGKNKNGWAVITKEEYEGKKDEVPADVKEAMAANNTEPTKTTETPTVDTEAEYKRLYEMGSGFAKDKKYAEALKKYEEALAVKETSNVKGRITKMKKAIEAEELESSRNELLETADAAVKSKDYEAALEAYEAANEMLETKEVTAKIEEVKTKQADELVS